MTVDEVIGMNVHELLWRRHMRQSALIDAMGVSRSSLAKKLRGEQAWLARDISTAARVLGVDPGSLFALGLKADAVRPLNDDGKTLWSRLATVHPIRPGLGLDADMGMPVAVAG